MIIVPSQEETLMGYLVTEEGPEHFKILPVVQSIIESYFPENDKVNITQLSTSIMACASEIQMHIESLDPEIDPDFAAPLIQEIVASTLGLRRLWRVLARYQMRQNLTELV